MGATSRAQCITLDDATLELKAAADSFDKTRKDFIWWLFDMSW